MVWKNTLSVLGDLPLLLLFLLRTCVTASWELRQCCIMHKRVSECDQDIHVPQSHTVEQPKSTVRKSYRTLTVTRHKGDN